MTQSQIDPEIRDTILRREGFKCKNCGITEKLHVHHILPKFRGGTDALDNIILLCSSCHRQEHRGINSPAYSVGPQKCVTVSVETETRDRLKEIGKKGESYDAIIDRLLDERDNSGVRSSHD